MASISSIKKVAIQDSLKIISLHVNWKSNSYNWKSNAYIAMFCTVFFHESSPFLVKLKTGVLQLFLNWALSKKFTFTWKIYRKPIFITITLHLIFPTDIFRTSITDFL